MFPSYGIVKGTPRSRFKARFSKNELEEVSLYINEDMSSRIVERTNHRFVKFAKR